MNFQYMGGLRLPVVMSERVSRFVHRMDKSEMALKTTNAPESNAEDAAPSSTDAKRGDAGDTRATAPEAPEAGLLATPMVKLSCYVDAGGRRGAEGSKAREGGSGCVRGRERVLPRRTLPRCGDRSCAPISTTASARARGNTLGVTRRENFGTARESILRSTSTRLVRMSAPGATYRQDPETVNGKLYRT